MPFTGLHGGLGDGGHTPGNSCDNVQLTSRHDRALGFNYQ